MIEAKFRFYLVENDTFEVRGTNDATVAVRAIEDGSILAVIDVVENIDLCTSLVQIEEQTTYQA